tara:strand:+ start:340 stop:873 length:534 start_codon:yes stop_codon:yes gene_type:complete
MHAFLIALLAVFLISSSTTMGQPGGLSSARPRFDKTANILDQCTGNWEITVMLKPSLLISKQKQYTQTKTVKWIVNGHFQQTTNSDESRVITHYDKDSKAYHLYSFASSDGKFSFWKGKWNKKLKTMTWVIQAGGYIEGSLVEIFEDVDTIKTTMLLKDARGAVLLNVETRQERVTN